VSGERRGLIPLRRPTGLAGLIVRALRPGRGGPFASAAMGSLLERTLGEAFDVAAERRGMLEQISLRTQWIAGTDERLGRLEASQRGDAHGERDPRFLAVLRQLVRAAFDESDVERLRLLQNAVINLHTQRVPLPEEVALLAESAVGLRQSPLRALVALCRGATSDEALARAAGVPDYAGAKLAADLIAGAFALRTGEALSPTTFGRALWAFLDDTPC